MTCSVGDDQHLAQTRQRVFMALFIALAVGLHTFEVLLPNPLPWFRIGLANILALTALSFYGLRAMWILSLSRVFIGSLLIGNLFGPGFLLSFTGVLGACLLMSAGAILLKRGIGLVGLSVLGATGHVFGQLLIADLVVVQHQAIWLLLPVFLLVALVSGVINGLVSDLLVDYLLRHPAFSTVRKGFGYHFPTEEK
ncbi:Gx transporter family protein [Geopsychrobacter electrodiphilus]|uniref:Gx transporter family protein n=1 Tax=Geopsychrobacter electrodiphilus TaxID=225196 RepID=UPI00037A705A|nr:Gx transporter family protein [Geopsychrobacter electrodiphilus]